MEVDSDMSIKDIVEETQIISNLHKTEKLILFYKWR